MAGHKCNALNRPAGLKQPRRAVVSQVMKVKIIDRKVGRRTLESC